MWIHKLKLLALNLLPKTDLPFEREEGSRLLPWIIAVMTVLSGLILASGFTFNRFAVSTISEYGRLYQIQVPHQDGEEKKIAQELENTLSNAPGIAYFRQLKKDEIKDLLSPWLGSSGQFDLLPVPLVIEIKLSDDQALERKAVTALDKVKKRYPSIVVDQYEQALQQFSNAAHTVQTITYGLGALIILATITIVVLATRTSVQLHFPIVRLLHRIGAKDGYISKQFQLNATVQTLKGAVPGTLVGWLLFMIFQHILSSYDLLALASPWQNRNLILFFLSLPVALAMVVALTTYGTVRQMLYRLF